jgi:hypothetical protein
MRIRVAAMLTSAMLLLPVAAASAHPASDQPQKKCPSLSFILNHCD